MVRVETEAGTCEQAGEYFGGSTGSRRCLLLRILVFSFVRCVLSQQQLWEPDPKFNRSIKKLVLTF